MSDALEAGTSLGDTDIILQESVIFLPKNDQDFWTIALSEWLILPGNKRHKEDTKQNKLGSVNKGSLLG